MLKALLRAGAGIDLKAADNDGRQPLHCLAQAHDDEETLTDGARAQANAAVALLKAAGADLDAADAKGKTPLMLAADRSPDNVIPALLRHGARIGAPERGAPRTGPDAQRPASSASVAA